MPPTRMPSSIVTTRRWDAASSMIERLHGHDPARVDDRRADPLRPQSLGDLDRDVRPSGRCRRAARPCASERDEHVDPVVEALEGAAASALTVPFGKRMTVGASSTATASRSSSRSRSASRGAAMRMCGHDLQHREVPDAVVARTVGAGDAGAVEHEGDAGRVQRDIHQHLVERAVHERRVDRDDRMQAAEREAGGRRPRRAARRCRRRRPGRGTARRTVAGPSGRSIAAVIADDVVGRSADGDELVGEHVGPRRSPTTLRAARPSSGSIWPTAWNWSASSSRAGS